MLMFFRRVAASSNELVNAFNKFWFVRKAIALLDAILVVPTAKWELFAEIHVAESAPKEHIVKKR